MFRTGHLWATDAGFMNDPKELRYGLDRLAEAAAAHRSLRPALPRLHEIVEKAARQKTLDGRIYLACFCRHGDLLSQWRAYGANGGGFAIGFSPRALTATAPQFQGTFTRVLQPVLYDKRQQDLLLGDCLAYISPESIENGEALKILLYAFSSFLMTFKHPSYREEGEWRLIQFGRLLNDDGLEVSSLWPTSFRVRGNQIVPYADLDLTGTAGALEGKLPAVSIVCGPTVNPERGVKMLREFCDSMGFCAVVAGASDPRRAADRRPRLVISASAAPFVG